MDAIATESSQSEESMDIPNWRPIPAEEHLEYRNKIHIYMRRSKLLPAITKAKEYARIPLSNATRAELYMDTSFMFFASGRFEKCKKFADKGKKLCESAKKDFSGDARAIQDINELIEEFENLLAYIRRTEEPKEVEPSLTLEEETDTSHSEHEFDNDEENTPSPDDDEEHSLSPDDDEEHSLSSDDDEEHSPSPDDDEEHPPSPNDDEEDPPLPLAREEAHSTRAESPIYVEKKLPTISEKEEEDTDQSESDQDEGKSTNKEFLASLEPKKKEFISQFESKLENSTEDKLLQVLKHDEVDTGQSDNESEDTTNEKSSTAPEEEETDTDQPEDQTDNEAENAAGEKLLPISEEEEANTDESENQLDNTLENTVEKQLSPIPDQEADISQPGNQSDDNVENTVEEQLFPISDQEADTSQPENQPGNDKSIRAAEALLLLQLLKGRENKSLAEDQQSNGVDDTLENEPTLEPQHVDTSKPNGHQPNEDGNVAGKTALLVPKLGKPETPQAQSQPENEALIQEELGKNIKKVTALFLCKVTGCDQAFPAYSVWGNHIMQKHSEQLARENILQNTLGKGVTDKFWCLIESCNDMFSDYQACERHLKKGHTKWYKTMRKKINRKERNKQFKESVDSS